MAQQQIEVKESFCVDPDWNWKNEEPNLKQWNEQSRNLDLEVSSELVWLCQIIAQSIGRELINFSDN